MAKCRIKVGDLLAIPVRNGFGFAKVLFLPKQYKNVVLLGLYELRCQTRTVPRALPVEFARLRFTSRQPIENGRWRIIGSMPLEGNELALGQPLFIVAGNLWEGDVFRGAATKEQKSNLLKMIVAGAGSLEDDVRVLVGEAQLSEDEQMLPKSPAQPLTLESEEFLERICRARTAKPIAESFNAITKGDYLEADECNQALAAAEVAAACRGFPVAGMPEDITAWCAKHQGLVDSQLISQAELAVNRILQDSELKELWSEGDGGAEWVAAVEDLLHRLTTPK